MSQLAYYDLPELEAIDLDEHGNHVTIMPGTMVRLKGWDKSLGVALTRCWVYDDKPMQVLVLWTHPPGLFQLPNIRRVSPGLIANQLVSVQPMTAPSGLVFFLDYQYGSGSKPQV